MTYRDDRDATLARADALQEDLKRVEAERDRLKAEVRKLEREREATPTSAPVQAIVTTRTQALTSREVHTLLTEVKFGLKRARSAARLGKVVALLLLVGSVPLFFVAPPWWAASVMVISLIGSVAALIDGATNDDAAVLAVVRNRPDDVLELVESDSGIKIVTRTKSARCTTPDRAELLVQLAKYCPNARVSGG